MFNVFSITDLPLQVKVRSTATEAKVMQKPATSTSNSGQQMGATECMGMLEQLLAKWCPSQPTYSIPGPKSQKVSSWRCQCQWHLISPLVEPAAPVAAQEKPALEAYEDEAFEALARKATKAGQGIAKGSDGVEAIARVVTFASSQNTQA